MSCNCTEAVNKQLEKDDIKLTTKISLDLKKGEMGTSPPIIQLEWKGKRRGRSLPTLVCTYCPFCGKKYEDGDGSDSG